MILPFATRTADVTKERVTGTLALPATRSLDAMVKATEVEARVYSPEMRGNVPVEVTSRMMGLVSDKSFEVAAAMLVNAACAAVGVVNFVTVKVIMVATLKVPVVSLMVNTELANTTVHVGAPELGAATEQTLVPSKAMPDPDSVMRIPALGPAVMALVGVNEIVAVVCVAFMADDRYTARF